MGQKIAHALWRGDDLVLSPNLSGDTVCVKLRITGPKEFQQMEHFASWLDLRVNKHGLVFFTSILTLASCLLSVIFNSQAHAKDVSFADFPFLVNCEVSGVHHAYYLSKIGSDGIAIYISPDNLAGKVTINGAAEPAMGGEGPGDCSGKTLEELRSAGQAFYLQR